MSKFYDEIAEHYDNIFPIKQAQINFLLENLCKPTSKILDVACGTGGYAIKLAEYGHLLTAIDLDSNMISELQKKDNKIQSQVLNMLEIDQLTNTFDLIYSLGNSIVHLDSFDLIEQFFHKCFLQLNHDGKLIIQIVNYDRILAKEIKSLPTIHNATKHLSFVRNYQYLKEEQKLAFNTILKVNNKSFENTVKLTPIQSFELVKLLKNSGFKNIEIFGNFSKQIFNPLESMACVIVASK